MPDPSELLDCAVTAARTAGAHALDNYTRRTEVLQRARHDVKLVLDVECQQKAENEIRKRYPDHALLGEESPQDDAEHAPDQYHWVIDPIDGTVNFSHGFPYWCCSVAVRLNDNSVAGCVYSPILDCCYTAHVDTAALCNGAPIGVSVETDLAHAIVLTGTDKNESTLLPSCEIFKRITESVQRTRVIGSAALDICHVAAGQADGYFETGVFLWDVSAASLILQQAGGQGEILAHLERPHCISYVASNGRIHGNLKDLVTL